LFVSLQVMPPTSLHAHWLTAGVRHAHSYRSIIAEPNKYMQYLMDRFLALGGKCQKLDSPLASLQPVVDKYAADVVINCTGLGSRELAQDKVSLFVFCIGFKILS
jgi:glycine/D-amino acid oxidase-like deaminating enzyme